MRHPRPLPAVAVAAALALLFASGTVRAQPRDPIGQNDRRGDGSQGALRTVDTHMHLHPTGLDQALSGRRRGPSAPRSRDRSGGDLNANLAQAASALVARMDELGVGAALVVVVPSERRSAREDYASVRTAVLSQPGRLFLMAGGARLGEAILATAPEAVTEAMAREFEAQARQLLDEGASGFGEMISYHLCMTERHSFKHAPADHPLFLRLADVAADADVPIDLHMEAIETAGPMPENLRRACSKNPGSLTATIGPLERLLRHNRKARIVWQHIGWDNVGQMTPMLLDRLLREHPNLYLALRVERRTEQVGGGGPMPNRIVDASGRIRDEWLKLATDHPDRLLIGSDEFVGPSGREPAMAASFADTWSMWARLPGDLARRIGDENPRSVYRLGHAGEHRTPAP